MLVLPLLLPNLALLQDGETAGWRTWLQGMGEEAGEVIPGAIATFCAQRRCRSRGSRSASW